MGSYGLIMSLLLRHFASSVPCDLWPVDLGLQLEVTALVTWDFLIMCGL